MMRYSKILCLIVALIVVLPRLAFSQQGSGELAALTPIELSSRHEMVSPSDPVDVQLVSEVTGVQAGHSFWVAVRLEVLKGWHLYWKNPGDNGLPLEVQWQLPEGFRVGELHWPYPHLQVDDNGTSYVYTGATYLLAEIIPTQQLATASDVNIRAKVSWMACHDSCIPGSSSISLTLPVVIVAPTPNLSWVSAFADARGKLPEPAGELTAEWTEQGVEIILPAGLKNYSTAYFFAEQAPNIPYCVKQKVVKSGGSYRLILDCDKEVTRSANALKGVIVLGSLPDEIFALEVKANVRVASSPITQAEEPLSLGWAVLLALIGGLILNLMPCVLPVIALKVMSFVKLAREERGTTIKHGLAFFAGVLSTFWLLVGVLLAFRAYGEIVGWGFQLQSPLFVALLALVLFVFSLNLFGLFEMGTSISSLAGQAQSRTKGLFSSFLSGVLATAVATPCTGPFLGTTVGFAVTLPAAGALLIFTAMGVGMALPYLLFAFFPQLLRFLPKPGKWMVTFKESMGFVILATVLWLSWVFGAHTDAAGLFLLLQGFLVAAIGCWTYGKWGSVVNGGRVRLAGSAVALSLLLVGAFTVVCAATAPPESEQSLTKLVGRDSAEKDEWIPFSKEKLAELRAQGIPVFIDFTAKWCLICQANKLVLNSDAVVRYFALSGVVKMRADWTKSGKEISEELRKFGRSGVPLYLLYGANADQEPTILPQVFTPELLVETVARLDRSSKANRETAQP